MEPFKIFEPKITFDVLSCQNCDTSISEGGAYYTYREYDEQWTEIRTELICIFCRTFEYDTLSQPH
jgi:hypothetical protein